ncbi:hypothetical protein A9798_12180 [Edwardsiella hoshinae]|uniref:Alpha/beta hydrolase family n=1 Tax=Edwardsiella hoshinae TaxID=93378 RepID=A0A376DKL6_9GAMM|nr:hypothetical protein [Edwardsiella hoshinae]AOV97633.1 hypothetical protein A9798_12180 [Edwardsiella hoshinae]QPR29466.1 hypothetical protein I6G97_07865 [Edwardsiella hoshinae]STC90397.1 Uncharacterised protein [Edwardsiella hoshinae]
MNVIAIPGKVPATQAWITQVAESLHLPTLTLQVHRFTAWQQPQAAFDLQAELTHMPQGQYDLLLSKSIGTLACVLTPALQARRMVFIGVALSLYNAQQRQALQALAERQPLLIIQQEADPFGSYQALAQLMGDRAQCRCVAGDDHLYNDVAELGQIIRTWLAEG